MRSRPAITDLVPTRPARFPRLPFSSFGGTPTPALTLPVSGVDHSSTAGLALLRGPCGCCPHRWTDASVLDQAAYTLAGEVRGPGRCSRCCLAERVVPCCPCGVFKGGARCLYLKHSIRVCVAQGIPIGYASAMPYDLSNLERLGRRAEKARAELAELLPQIRAEVIAALDAGERQVDVAKAARYTRDAIYKIGMRPRDVP